MAIKVYLDDVRRTPPGWVRVNTVTEAIDLFTTIPADQIDEMSLDHDLGCCEDCAMDHSCLGQGRRAGCKCHCHLEGSQLVDWMEENDYWPPNPPTVHSSNPAGRAYMQMVINKKYKGGV